MAIKHKLYKFKSNPINQTLTRLIIVILFSIAFGYIEAAVVVYLREIFHPDGFSFPIKLFTLDQLSKHLLRIEVGREISTLVLILTSCLLFGRNRRQRVAYFFVIFALWDIFYYVWLKVLINWPASIMDYDILFLIPMVWASPALAPILVSLTMLIFAAVVLMLDAKNLRMKFTLFDLFGYLIAALIIVSGFCYAGRFHEKLDFDRHYSWLVFAAGEFIAVGIFTRRVVTNYSHQIK